jgi:S1-C subfamily serine protease
VPEGYLGKRFAEPAGGRGARPPRLDRDAAANVENGARYAGALSAVKPEASSRTRGAKEVRVYQDASPGVVLVVGEEKFGSGVVIGADGTIVTNLHVVGADSKVEIIFKPMAEGADPKDGEAMVGRVIKRDEIADLALVKVPALPPYVKPLAIAATSGVQVGADVHAIGHPTGEAWTYTRGIVSQVRRDYAWTAEDKLDHKATVIQTQTPINPGNSGGPLLDDDLQVIGLNSFKGEGEGLNFAVSAEDIRAFLARSGDRKAPATGRAQAAAARLAKPPAKGACETKVMAMEKETKPIPGDLYFVDIDCDNKTDAMVLEPTDPKEPIMMMMDTKRDNLIDVILIDENRDGEWEAGYFDTDRDGDSDVVGYIRPGEDDFYRYERLEK